jgi:iron complex transport system substrate-binding protein
MDWDDVIAAKPELIITSPCGYNLERAIELARELRRVPGAELYAVDANAYFARPGPRVVEGIELLAHLFHRERVDWTHGDERWARIY